MVHPPRPEWRENGRGKLLGVAEHEAGHLRAQPLAGNVVEAGVLAGEDPAEAGFVGGGLESRELRAMPGIPTDVTVTVEWRPQKEDSTVAAASLKPLWAPG